MLCTSFVYLERHCSQFLNFLGAEDRHETTVFHEHQTGIKTNSDREMCSQYHTFWPWNKISQIIPTILDSGDPDPRWPKPSCRQARSPKMICQNWERQAQQLARCDQFAGCLWPASVYQHLLTDASWKCVSIFFNWPGGLLPQAQWLLHRPTKCIKRL